MCSYPQHWYFIIFMGNEERQTRQRLLQIFAQNLHSLSRRHLLVLLILTLYTETKRGYDRRRCDVSFRIASF